MTRVSFTSLIALRTNVVLIITHFQNDIRWHVFFDLFKSFINFISNFYLVAARLGNHTKVYGRHIVFS